MVKRQIGPTHRVLLSLCISGRFENPIRLAAVENHLVAVDPGSDQVVGDGDGLGHGQVLVLALQG